MKRAVGGATAELLMLAAAEPTTKAIKAEAQQRSTSRNREPAINMFLWQIIYVFSLLRTLWTRLSADLRPRAAPRWTANLEKCSTGSTLLV